MAQEFASDSSVKNGFLSRLNLSNHRGFFSVIFVSLSLVLLLVTFAAVRQQQTTQTKASEVDLCSQISCADLKIPEYRLSSYSPEIPSNVVEATNKCKSSGCCDALVKAEDLGLGVTKMTTSCNSNGKKVMSSCEKLTSFGTLIGKGLCESFETVCEWKDNKCITKSSGGPIPTCKTDGLCKAQGECCTGYDCTSKTGTLKYCTKRTGTCEKYTGQACGNGGSCQTSVTCEALPVGGSCMTSSNQPGTYKSGLCPGGAETRCCVPNGSGPPPPPPPPPTTKSCNELTSEKTCNANSKCYYQENEKKCVERCQQEKTQSTCDARTDCAWNAALKTSNCKPKCPYIYAESACTSRKECAWKSNKCISKESTPTPTPTSQSCKSLPNEKKCIANSKCYWIPNEGGHECVEKCQLEKEQKTCDKRVDCYWDTTVKKANCKSECAYRFTEPICTLNKECSWENKKCINKTEPPENKDVDLNLKLAFQGVVSKPKTTSKVSVKVKLVDAANKEVVKDGSPFTVDDNGIWSGKVSFKNIDINQKYYILIKGPLHLQKKICHANASETKEESGYYSCIFGNIKLKKGANDFDFSKILLLAGDIDRNGVVDSFDARVVQNATLSTLDQRISAELLKKADLNYDGVVNTQDWDAVMAALGIKNDEK